MTYFNCDKCSECILSNISNTLDCDLSEVTVCDFLNNNRCVFENESKTKILAHIDKQLIESKHICDQINHIKVSYGNDGPFFSFHYKETDKYTDAYAVLLNPVNDTFRIYDHE